MGKQWRIIKSPLRKNIDVAPPQKVPGERQHPTTREVQFAAEGDWTLPNCLAVVKSNVDSESNK